MNRKWAYAYIITAAVFWGIIGIFITFLYEKGFNPTQVVAIRAISATIFLLTYILFKNRGLLKIKLSDSKYFVGTGIFSFVLFNLCLFYAIQETTIAISAILLYSAPAFVTIISRILFKEALTPKKILALFTTFIGCSFVVGIFTKSAESVSLLGILLGLGAGFFYALYSIFGTYALRKYNTITVTVYTFIFATIAITPFSGLSSARHLFQVGEIWLYILGLGLISTTLAFVFYTKGLGTIESSNASIIATIEPVVAALVSFFIFKETLNFTQYLGMLMVLAAVIIIQDRRNKDMNADHSTNHFENSN
ncbi:DMT family transporter [Calidifontibacillus oryziterrae]|uniref:DMT family transporter n=1 Tax=Calidifontibacillus oryziterrae TaxID=1191699 RepID=UPI0003071E22|nr:DMT family transporter [Calidifontibacillus oryziterrae]